MRRLKRRNGVRFGKRFEGVCWKDGMVVEEENGTMGKGFSVDL